MDSIVMRKLYNELYEYNKNLTRDEYEINKRNAMRAYSGVTALDDFTDALGMSSLVSTGDLVGRKVIADWYTDHSYDWIQGKKRDEEFRERERKRHEELMSTSPEYRAKYLEQEEKKRLEAEERECERRESEKRFKSKRILWVTGCILSGGIIGGLISAISFGKVTDAVDFVGTYAVANVVICMLAGLIEVCTGGKATDAVKGGCAMGCVVVIGSAIVMGIAILVSRTMATAVVMGVLIGAFWGFVSGETIRDRVHKKQSDDIL